MTEHHLKVWPEFFDAMLNGIKKFEYRKDDRAFMVGDSLILQEYDPKVLYWSIPTRKLHRTITYILKGCPGLADGYVVLGIEPMRQP